MELKLNIYDKKRSIVKTYTTDTCFIFYGTVEDILGIIEGVNFNDDAELIKIVCKFLPKVKVILKDVFVGLTDKELKMTNIIELAKTCMNIIKFCMEQVTSLDSTNDDEKN